MVCINTIKIVITKDVIDEYADYYRQTHPRSKKPPIKQPYHESINQWMIMRRPAMNGLKQRWKEFIKWLVDKEGYTNLRIEQCEILQIIYYSNNRRHDIDNSVPKFLLDGLVESGMIVDDDNKHVTKLTLQSFTDTSAPRTELYIYVCDSLQSTDDVI